MQLRWLGWLAVFGCLVWWTRPLRRVARIDATSVPCNRTLPPASDTVTIVIMAHNSAHWLPDYLWCVERQTFPAHQTSILVRTNDNLDDTERILRDWITRVQRRYARVEMDASSAATSEETRHMFARDHRPDNSTQLFFESKWNAAKVQLLARLREETLERVRAWGTRYYFCIDSDNFVVPQTLDYLVRQRKPLIGPYLVQRDYQGLRYYLHNNWMRVGEQRVDGKAYYHYEEHPAEKMVRFGELRGILRVPMVQCTYLIDLHDPRTRVLTYVRGRGVVSDLAEDIWEFHTFAASARRGKVPMYSSNEFDFGYVGTRLEDMIGIREEMQRLADAYGQ